MIAQSTDRRPGTGQPLAVLDGVTKAFGGVVAVSDVTFSIEEGTITGIIGPNGAGKTTLLNLITGFLVPTSGTIKIGDVDVTGWRPQKLAATGVARTYQNILLLDSETVATNILLGRHIALSSRPISRRIREWRRHPGRDAVRAQLADLDLVDVADLEVSQLPYGTRRRIEIARALAADPRLLILDEPTAGMTREESDEIGALIQQVRRRGTSVLLVEHNVRLVKAVCDEVLVLDWGALIARDSASRIWDHAAVRTAYLGELSDEETPEESDPGREQGRC